MKYSNCHTEFKYFGEMTNTRKHFAFQSNVGEKQPEGTTDQQITASTQIKKGKANLKLHHFYCQIFVSLFCSQNQDSTFHLDETDEQFTPSDPE